MNFFISGFEKHAKELIIGGKADGKPSSDFPEDQIAKGKKVEREHTDNPSMAEEIARDHLTEDKKYYTHLKEMEDKHVKKAFDNGFDKAAKELTAKGRKRISEGNFALPGRRYPIHDISHARNALARVSQFGNTSEQKAVRSAVHSKYPSLKDAGNDSHDPLR